MELEEYFGDLQSLIVDTEDRSGDGMDRARITFANGYGISVISGWMAYGNYEIAVIGPDGSLDYSTPVTSDVEPCHTLEEVAAYAREISQLPPKD